LSLQHGSDVSDPLPRVKEPHLAGRWYPADPAALAARVRELVRADGATRRALALVVPHGPFEHSGAVAGAAYGVVEPPHRAIVLAPTHFASFRGACVLPVAGYRTPLGVMPVDGDAAATLARAPGVRANPAVFMREHAVEAQLPFLQTCAPGATLVPVLLGTLEPGEAAALAAAIRPLLDAGTLLVASSDLVHYGRRHGFLPVPPTDAEAVRAAVGALEDDALAHIATGDADAFARWADGTGAPVCGRQAIEVLLRALPAGTRGECVARASSLDFTAAHDTAVGYGAVVFPERSA
jgi:AmmeMemoRadiSam system protein B